MSYRIVKYKDVPYGSRFRLKGRWWKISATSLTMAEYFTGASFIKERIHCNTRVGIDQKFTAYDSKH